MRGRRKIDFGSNQKLMLKSNAESYSKTGPKMSLGGGFGGPSKIGTVRKIRKIRARNGSSLLKLKKQPSAVSRQRQQQQRPASAAVSRQRQQQQQRPASAVEKVAVPGALHFVPQGHGGG